MNDVFVYNVKITGVSKKYSNYFKVGKLYKVKYIISSQKSKILSDKKEWTDISEILYDEITYAPISKMYKVKKQFTQYINVGSTFLFLISYDNQYIFYNEKIYEIKKYLIPA